MMNCAVIGYGHIGRRHVSVFEQHPGCHLEAICEIRDVTNLPDVPAYNDIDTMMGNHHLDIVSICTPNGLHASQTIRALEQGAHVICEKPFALTSEDAQQMVKMAASRERHLICVLQNRYSPPVQWLKSILDQGLLGQLYQAQINCFWNRDDRYYLTESGQPHPWHGTRDMDGGPLFTQFSHFVDIMVWMLGEITVEHAQFKNFAHPQLSFEDAGTFTFSWNGGGMGVFHYSTAVWDANQESSITLIGSRGSVRIGGQYMNRIEYCHIKDSAQPDLPPVAGANEYGGYRGSANNHFFVINNMVETVMGKSGPDFDVRDAVNGVGVIEQVYRHRNE